jgi:hypothetical protein
MIWKTTEEEREMGYNGEKAKSKQAPVLVFIRVKVYQDGDPHDIVSKVA